MFRKPVFLVLCVLWLTACGSNDALQDNEVPSFLQLPLSRSDIHLLDTPEKLVHALDHISKAYEIIAVDVVLKPNLGIFGKEAALFQLAVWDAVYLVDITALKEFQSQPMCDAIWKKIFHNEEIVKLGFDTETDFDILMKTMNCRLENSGKCSSLANLKHLFQKIKTHYPKVKDEIEELYPSIYDGIHTSKSKSHFTQAILGKLLDDSEQHSNWESRPLSEDQLSYAALNAYAPVLIRQKLDPLLENLHLDFETLLRKNCAPCNFFRLKREKRDSKEVTCPCVDEELNSPTPEKDEWYPSYHLAPQQGWMNDPNGLIYFDGYYHAFYQHNPDQPIWGPMHWGHARSRNMIEWEHLPIALSPSIDEDRDGCFSGSAVDDGGILTLIYTGNVFVGQGDVQQVTCIATSADGINFTKHGKVLDPPPDIHHFRDPKVWRQGDKWYMVMGTRVNDVGQAHLYRSDNLRDWEFDVVLASADSEHGYMWECPDFFALDDKHLLVMSPQGMHPKGYDYRNLYQSGHFVGSWQPGHPFNVEQDFREIDHGHDIYAPQTFLAPDNRRIMIGWMDMWESPMPEQKQNWSGTFTLPRQLILRGDGNVMVLPVKEVETIRQNLTHIDSTLLKDEFLNLECNVKAMEIDLVWNSDASSAEKYGLKLSSLESSEEGLFLYIDSQAQRLVLDRRYPRYNLSGYRSIPIPNLGLLSLRVFFDHSSIEVFANDGAACMSSRIYPSDHLRCLSLFAANGQALLANSSRWTLAS